MASRPPPPALRRLVFGVLFVFALVIPLVLWILVATQRLIEPAGILTLVRWWSAATALLLIWSAIHIKEEPGTARIALYFSAALFALFTLFAHANMNSGTATPPAQGEKGKKTGMAPKAGKLQEAILGKWQLDGTKETSMFLKDGMFVVRSDQGQTVWGRSYFLDPNRLQLFFAMGKTPKPYIFNDLAVTGDTMSRTLDSGKKTTYRRIKTKPDTAGVTGIWRSGENRALVLAIDGTFVFGDDGGTWEANGQQIVIKSDREQGGTWHLTKSSDGNSLSGDWTVTAGSNSMKKTMTFTHRPNLKNLAEAIVGKWQLLGHTETSEYSRDGTATLTSDAGESLTLNYAVVDATHIQVSARGQEKSATWTIVTMNEDSLTTSTSEGKKPATYIRVN